MQSYGHQLIKPPSIARNHLFAMAESKLHQCPESTVDNTNPISSEFLSLLILGVFVLLYVILFRSTFEPKQLRTPFESATKIPCKHCRFYSPNPHIQCAVHPSKVSTFNAIHCSDYDSKSNDFYRNSPPRK